jgi:hypothetical protein
MEEMHFKRHVAAELLVRSNKISHKLPEVDGFYISQKTSRNMLKSIPGCLLFITENDIKLRVSEELTYLEANEYTRLNLLRGNFSHKNENAGPFLASASTNLSCCPI